MIITVRFPPPPKKTKNTITSTIINDIKHNIRARLMNFNIHIISILGSQNATCVLWNFTWGILLYLLSPGPFPCMYSDGGIGPVYCGTSPGNLGDVISAVRTSALAFLTGYCWTTCLDVATRDPPVLVDISSLEDDVNWTNWRPVGRGILVGGPDFLLAMASWNREIK